MKKLINKFLIHPSSVQETYIQHLCFASKNAAVLLKTSLALLIHGIFPFYFTNYTTIKINQLSNLLTKRKTNINDIFPDTLKMTLLDGESIKNISNISMLNDSTQSKTASSLTLSILDFVGNTPMLPLLRFNPNLGCNLFVKCEMFNPTLSIKD